MSLILSGTDGLSDVDGSAATPAIRGTDANTGIFFPAADTIAFAEGGAECARFDSSGNFGLGVTPSAWSNYKAIQMGSGVGLASYTAGAIILNLGTNQYYNGTNYVYVNTDFAASYQQTAGIHKWWTAASGTAGNAITFTQAMTLDASGNLSLGNTYSIGGNYLSLAIGGSKRGIIAVRNSAATDMGYMYVNETSGLFTVESAGANPLVLSTNGAERARINSAGMLSVNYTSAISGGLFIVSSNGTKGSLIVKNDDSVQLYSLGTGTVTCSGGVLGFTSDERIKIDDGNYSGGLNAVLNITPKYFYYKNSEGNKDETKGRELGFFAQNIQQTCGLEVVHQPEDPDALLGIHDRGVMAVLVSAIQEQQALIQTLTARITALENK